MMSVPKRTATDTERDAMSSAYGCARSDGQSNEMTALLQRVSQRVRKAVTEGYIVPVESSPEPSASLGPSPPPPNLTGTGVQFRSARDTLRDVFGSALPRGSSTPSSPLKRAFNAINQETDALKDDETAPLESDRALHDTLFDTTSNVSCRPKKPLRRARRGFTSSKSLPAGMLFSRDEESHTDSEPVPVSDDDWSPGPSNPFFNLALPPLDE